MKEYTVQFAWFSEKRIEVLKGNDFICHLCICCGYSFMAPTHWFDFTDSSWIGPYAQFTHFCQLESHIHSFRQIKQWNKIVPLETLALKIWLYQSTVQYKTITRPAIYSCSLSKLQLIHSPWQIGRHNILIVILWHIFYLLC